MGLQTAYAHEIPGRVKGNRQYSRSFVYCRKLACSTVSLSGDRVRGDDSKQYTCRHYKSTYSTVKGFSTSPLTPAENCSEPPAIPVTCQPRTTADPPRSCGGILNYLYKRMERQSNLPQTTADPLTWEFNRSVQIFNPFHRIPLSAGVRGLVKKNRLYCITKQGFCLTESHEISIAS